VKYKIAITPEAEEDLKEIFKWYENQRTDLGHDFLRQVDSGIRTVKNNPMLFAEQYIGSQKIFSESISLQNILQYRNRQNYYSCNNLCRKSTDLD